MSGEAPGLSMEARTEGVRRLVTQGLEDWMRTGHSQSRTGSVGRFRTAKLGLASVAMGLLVGACSIGGVGGGGRRSAPPMR